MTRYLSGVQPTGLPHLGNYFGAIEQHIHASRSLGPTDSAFFFIADYHALTTIHDAAELAANVRAVAATYLALGLDVERAVFFRQSSVPEVVELTWLLATVTGMGLLERAHSYKDKVAKSIVPSVGLFTYPVLMASDIVIYDADVVPVGQDQVQHVEMAQDMVGHFNARYGGEFLKRPEWKLSRTPKVPGVDGDKMSKSYNNFIGLFEEGKGLKAAMKRIVTDSRLPDEPKDPDGVTLFKLLELFLEDDERKTWRERVQRGGPGAPGYGDMKKELTARMDARFGAARAAYADLTTTPAGQRRLDEVLDAGAVKARQVARETLARCYAACGLDRAAARARTPTA
jgi:tryptophanyl-tRNA synthetase